MDRAGKPIDIPDWLNAWPAVVAAVRKIEDMGLPNDHEPILHRLVTDIRMKDVWVELTNRERVTGNYLHPAVRQPGIGHTTPEMAQAYALGLALFQAFKSTADKRAAGKPGSVEEARQRLLSEARTLQTVAADLFRSTAAAPAHIAALRDLAQYKADAMALLRVAAWREELAAELRDSDDPLTVRHDRGDALARGVGSDMASLFEAHFGDRLYGLAAKIASVATGETTTASAVRSAFPAQSGNQGGSA